MTIGDKLLESIEAGHLPTEEDTRRHLDKLDRLRVRPEVWDRRRRLIAALRRLTG